MSLVAEAVIKKEKFTFRLYYWSPDDHLCLIVGLFYNRVHSVVEKCIY